MSSRVIVAYNQTVGDLPLGQLSAANGVIPGSGSVTLTDYNHVHDILADQQLQDLIDAGDVLLGTPSVLTQSESQDLMNLATFQEISNAAGIDRRVTVGTGGAAADYTSIKDAVDAAILGGASPTTPWLIEVYPGEYTEDNSTPIDIPWGIVLSTANMMPGQVTITPSTPTEDLFTLSGGAIVGMNMQGVTGAAKAAIRCTHVGGSHITSCRINNVTNGVIIDGAGVFVIAFNLGFPVIGAGKAIGTGVKIDNGAKFFLNQCQAIVTAATSALYAGSPSTGSIGTVVPGSYTDGQTFTLDDGVNPPTTFEFDTVPDGPQGAGNVAVDISAAVTDDDVKNAIISAISGAASLDITATDGGAATVTLTNDVNGTLGDNAIVLGFVAPAVGNPPGTFTGMSGGVDDVDPINIVFDVDNGAEITATAINLEPRPNTDTSSVVLANNGAECFLGAANIEHAGNALHIGAGGSGSSISIQNGHIEENVTNFFVESATGTILVSAQVDTKKETIVPGAAFNGLIFERTNERSILVDDVFYEFHPAERLIPLGHTFHTYASTGYIFGGDVTDGGGLTVDVSAGEGFVSRDGAEMDLNNVSWGATAGLAVTPSTTNYVYFNGETLSLSVGTGAPGIESILLARVITDGTGVRFIHEGRTPIFHPQSRLHDYLIATRKFTLDTGLAVSAGSTATKFDVALGSYYRAIQEVTYAGVSDATFSYFYGTNGANEVSGQTDVSTTQYDNAGALTAMTAGYFRSDTVIITSDGRISVVYGTAEYALQADAVDSATVSTIPTFMEESGIHLARLIVEEAVGIVEIVDARPVASAVGAGGGGGGGISDHGLLSGLGDDDHTQYLLTSGARAMAGNLDMGANNVTNVGTVDGVDVDAHASRHNPGGADALTTAAPSATSVGGAPSEGAAASFARSDHNHGTITIVGQTRGDILTMGVSDWQRTALGGTGTYLTSDGTDAVWGSLPSADETTPGIIETATQPETDAGTDDTRAITPLKLANAPIKGPRVLETGGGPYTLVAADIGKVMLLTGGNNATLPSPATVGPGWWIDIKEAGNSNLSDIVRAGAENIDGSAADVSLSRYESRTLVTDGTDWWSI
jgi:hypothetical protein